MTTTPVCTFTKLRIGGWGLRGANLSAGQRVKVARRDGSICWKVVGRVLTQPDRDGVVLATIVEEDDEQVLARQAAAVEPRPPSGREQVARRHQRNDAADEQRRQAAVQRVYVEALGASVPGLRPLQQALDACNEAVQAGRVAAATRDWRYLDPTFAGRQPASVAPELECEELHAERQDALAGADEDVVF